MLPLRAVRSLLPLGAPRGLAVVGARFHVLGDGALWSFPRQGPGPGRQVVGEPGAASGLLAVTGGAVLALGPGGTGLFWSAPELVVAPRPVDLGPLGDALPQGAPGAACVRGEHLVLALPGALAVCALAPLLDAARAGTGAPATALLEVHALAGPATALAALPDGRLLLADDDSVTLVARDGRPQEPRPFPPHRGAPGEPAPRRRIAGLLAAPRGDGTVDLLLTASVGGAGQLLGGALRL